MLLRIFVGLMLLMTLGLMIGRPALVGNPPHRPAKRSEALAYSKRALAFTGALIASISSAGVGSIVLVRRAKQDYQRLAMENMRQLIESTLQDQKNKPS